MKTSVKRFICILFLLSISFAGFTASAADVQFVTIGTAAPGGTFYILGN